MSTRQQFAETTTELMADHQNVVLLLGDIGTWGFRNAFARFPKRCFNTGPAEQALVGIAAGFAKEGFYPVVHSISSFLLRRAYEQIFIDFGVQKLPGLFVGIHRYPKLGPTHCCGEDLRLVSNVEGMGAYFPTTPLDAHDTITECVATRRLAYIRVN